MGKIEKSGAKFRRANFAKMKIIYEIRKKGII